MMSLHGEFFMGKKKMTLKNTCRRYRKYYAVHVRIGTIELLRTHVQDVNTICVGNALPITGVWSLDLLKEVSYANVVQTFMTIHRQMKAPIHRCRRCVQIPKNQRSTYDGVRNSHGLRDLYIKDTPILFAQMEFANE